LAKGYKILEVDDEEEEEPEVMNIRCVECEPVVSWRQKVAQTKNNDDDPEWPKKCLSRNRSFSRRSSRKTTMMTPNGQTSVSVGTALFQGDHDRYTQVGGKTILLIGPEGPWDHLDEYKLDDKIKKPREVMEIRAVEKEPVKKPTKWASLGVGEIAVDSAADESCWPKDLGGAFETKPSTKNILLRTANGGEMGHYGEKEITFRSGASEDVIGLRFQVTDVKKPLLAVRRLVERGNVVSFGPGPNDNYIQNIETSKKIPMEKRGGSFVIQAHFVKEMCGGAESGFTRQVR
jgi:hypothetical protein